MRPHRRHPTRLSRPGILQARTLEWVAISFSNACKTAQRYCYVCPLRGSQDSALRLHCFLIVPALSLHPLPSLIVCTCLLERREGPGGWMKPISCSQEMGDPERLCAQEPHRVLLGFCGTCKFMKCLSLFIWSTEPHWDEAGSPTRPFMEPAELSMQRTFKTCEPHKVRHGADVQSHVSDG